MANNVFSRVREESISGSRNSANKYVTVFTATHRCIVIVDTRSGSLQQPLRETYILNAGQSLSHFTGAGFSSYTPHYNYNFVIMELE